MSRWSEFAASVIYDWYDTHWRTDATEIRLLQQYAQARKELGWDRELEILKWAEAEFPANADFEPLRPAMEHFLHSAKPGKNGQTLASFLHDQIPALLENTKGVRDWLGSDEVKGLIEKVRELLPNDAELMNELDLFLAYYPRYGMQGSANVSGFSLAFDPESPKVRSYIELFCVHELLHTILRPRLWFQSNYAESLQQTVAYAENRLYDLCEEGIIESVCDVYLFGLDPSEEIAKVRTGEHYSPERKAIYIMKWTAAKLMAPHVIAYLEDELEVEGCREMLLQAAQELIQIDQEIAREFEVSIELRNK